MSKRQATGGHSKHGTLDDEPDDEELQFGWGTRHSDVDRKKAATTDQMSTRKIAPLKGARRPGGGGLRSGSPAGGVNALGNIFGGSPQPPQTNGVNGNASFGTSFGQNPQQAQNSMFGSSQQTQSFPAPTNNSSNTFTFGTPRQSQSPSPAPQQQASFSFPPQSGSSGGFTFSAGPSGNNPFANLNGQQSTQQNTTGSNVFGGSTSQFTFGASSGQPNASTFGAGKPQGSIFGQSQMGASSKDQQQPMTSPTDGAMQISPPATPARGTGQEGQQQSSISQTLSQGQKQNSQTLSNGLFGASKPTSTPSFGLFSPHGQQQSQDSQSKPSQAPLFGQSIGQSKAMNQDEATTPSEKTQTPLFGTSFGQKPQEQGQSSSQAQQPQTSLFGQSSGQKQQDQNSSSASPSKSTNPFESVQTPPQASSQPPPATAPPKPSFNLFQPPTATPSTSSGSASAPNQAPQTEPRPGQQSNSFGQTSGHGSTLFGSPQKISNENQRQQEYQLEGQSVFSAETPESFTDEQKEEYEKQKKIVSLNRSFVSVLRQINVTQDQSAMMQAYLSEIGKIKTAVTATQQSFRAQTNTPNANNKRKADASTSEAPPSKKPTSVASGSKAPSVSQPAPSAQPTPPTPAAPSPQRSQTASLFSNIVGSSSPAQQNEQSREALKETPRASSFFGTSQRTGDTPRVSFASQNEEFSPPEPPNPFADLKKWAPPAQQSSDHFTPKPQEKSAPPSNMFGASTSSNLFTPKPAPARSVSPEKAASAARNLFERSSSPTKSAEKNNSSTPLAPTPSPFTSSSSAQTPSFFNAQATPNKTPSFAPSFTPSFTPSTKPTTDKGVSPAPPTFSIPKFGAGSGTNFLSQFGQAAKKTEEADRKKRKAEDFDSDEDDEAEWERKDAEAQAEKKRKIEEERKKAPKFTFSGTPTSSRESSQGPSASGNPFGGANIFGHLTNSSKAGSVASGAGEDRASSEDVERQEGEQSDSARGSSQARDASEAPSEQTPEPSASQGKSLFDRITPADSSTKVTEPSETPKKNPFASSNGVSNGLFGSQTSPAGDNTWKPDSPLKFGDSGSSANNAPTFKFTPSTPGAADSASGATSQSKTPMSNLFGSPAPGPTPSLFGTASKPQFSFGGPPKVNSFLSSARANDDTASNTSRGTSPALSTTGTDADGESVNGDEGGDHEAAKDEQLDLTGVPEDEEVVFEKEQVKAMEMEDKTWKTRGIGVLRILKNKDTGIYSVLLRQVPGGKVVINTRLQKGLQYKDAGKGKVTLSIPKATKAGTRIASWFLNFSQKSSSEAAKFVEVTEGAKEEM